MRTEALGKLTKDDSVAARQIAERSLVRTVREDRGASRATDDAPTTVRNTSKISPGYLDQRILVVDDDRASRTLISRVLKNLGVSSIDVVSSGDEVLARFEDAPSVPQLVICDLEMPGMDGEKLLRHLAQRDLRAPLVLVGDADERVLGGVRNLARSHRLLVLGAIRKPVTPERLGRVLSRFGSQVFATEDSGGKTENALTDAMLRSGLAAGGLQVRVLAESCYARPRTLRCRSVGTLELGK